MRVLPWKKRKKQGRKEKNRAEGEKKVTQNISVTSFTLGFRLFF
jgi:hypothetical protein